LYLPKFRVLKLRIKLDFSRVKKKCEREKRNFLVIVDTYLWKWPKPTRPVSFEKMNAKEMPLWNHFLIVICTPHLMKLHPFLQLVSCLLFLIFGKKAKKKGKKN
jgi:hypothetical protein